MSGQNTLLTICKDVEAKDPETTGAMQMYLNQDDGQLHGKVKGGEHIALAIKLPNVIGETTDGVPKEIFLNSIVPSVPSRLKQPLNSATFYSYFVMAMRSNDPGRATGITQLQFLVKNNAGVVTIIVTNGPAPLNTGDAEAAAWTANTTIGGDNNDEIILTVTGEAGKTISWNATIVKLGNVEL